MFILDSQIVVYVSYFVAKDAYSAVTQPFTYFSISNDNIMIFNCGKVWKEWNGWIKVVMGTRFLKFKAISAKFVFVLPGMWSSHFCSMESAGSFQNFCRIMFILLLFVSLVWFCCWIYVICIEQLSNNSWISVSTAIFNC